MPPTALLDSLQGVRRKLKAYSVAQGTAAVIACAIALLLLTVFLDWALNLPPTPRLLIILGALGGLGYVLYQWIARPAMARMSLGDVAGHLENTFPQFDDRLRSTIDFVRGDMPGSPVMKERVVTQATQLAREVDLTRAIETRPVWYATGAALAAMLLLGLAVSLVSPEFRRIATSRLFNPLHGRPWPKSVEIQAGAVPQRVAVGDVIPVHVTLTKGDKPGRKVVLRYRYDKGPWQEDVVMERRDGAYISSLDTRLDQSKPNSSLEVQVEAGDDEAQLAPITIVPRLDLKVVEARVTPPAYVQPNNASQINLAERPAVMAVGSDVALHLAFNKDLDRDQAVALVPVRPGQKLPEMTWERQGDRSAVAHFKAAESMRFAIRGTDSDHFTNSGSSEYELLVREDQPPTVQIEEPRRSEDRTAIAQFDLKAIAEDDYGIRHAQLVVNRMGNTNGPAAPDEKNLVAPAPVVSNAHWVIDLVHDNQPGALGVTWQSAGGTAERKRFSLTYDWDLAKLEGANLKPGDVLEYFVQVKDNFDLDGRQHDWVPSGRLRITIVSPESFVGAVERQLEQVHHQLAELDKAQQRNKAETEALRQATEKKPNLDEADRQQAERIAGQQSMTASQTMQAAQKLQQLSQQMKENKTDGGLKPKADAAQQQLQETAEGAMKQAANELNQAKEQKSAANASKDQQQKDAAERSQAMAKAGDDQQKASDQLKKAMDKLGNFDGVSEFRQRLEDIRKEQEKLGKDFTKEGKDLLGKKPDELTKDQQDQLKKMAEKQDQLQKQTQSALDQMNKKGDQLSKADPAASQALKQAAQTGQQQQVPGKQSQSAQAMQQNQQAQAQQAQKQVELGLDMIIAKLKEAEKRKLEELQQKLAELQKLVNELVQRQAGHNIDNLLLQGGPARLEKIDSKVRQELLELSARDEKSPAGAAALKDLNGSQRITERNTRDIAKKAEELPENTASAKLTAAAGHMERAIVHLNDNKLADAYDPPQVQALAALVEAKSKIDEAKQKVDEQQRQEDEETIKQAYVKLLEEQKKLGESIVEIDKTPKDNGELPRPVAVRLGQLPGVQGGLSEKATKLGEKLESLKSIVYVWANKDIVKSMDEVKDDLAKPETGTPTQAEERRIEEQLQAMVDNLNKKQEQQRFAQRQNGGGGGGGGAKPPPKMPTDVELRLLKDLQQAVNKSTHTIDAEKVKDNAKLLGLGGRQGDLRNLLDQLLQNATQGKVKLGDEPDNKEQLPEEASKEDIENQEFDKQLRSDDVQADTVEKTVKLTGDRMARSRQRLAINNDPGNVTQEIQKRIVLDLDNMIKLAQQQQAQSKPGNGKGKPSPKPGDPKPGDPKNGQQQVAQKGPKQNDGGSTPAQDSALNPGSDPQADLSQDLKERLEEWGKLHPRAQGAKVEASSEKALPKYDKLVQDYYKSLSSKTAQQ